MKNIIKRSVIIVSIFSLIACGGSNDKGYKLWKDSLSSGSRVDYCYYVKVDEESTTYYDAFAYYAQATTGGFLPLYSNFKYVDGSDAIIKIEKSVYREKYNAVKQGTIKGSYGKIV